MSNGKSGNLLGRTIIDMIRSEGAKPDILELATIQQDFSLLCDKFTVPIPSGQYLVGLGLMQTVPLLPGNRVLIAWLNGTEPVVIDVVVNTI